MATITVLDGTGATQTVAKVSATGATTGANSLPVVIATDDAMISQLHTDLTASNSQLPPTPSGSVTLTITRPGNVTGYTAGDVIGGAQTIATGMTSNQRIMLASMDIMPQIGAIPSGMTTFDVHFYSTSPPSAVADNGAWDLASGDRSSYLGKVTSGNIADLGSTLYVQNDGINRPFQLVGGANLYCYVVTTGSFTPANNSEVYQVRFHFLGL